MAPLSRVRTDLDVLVGGFTGKPIYLMGVGYSSSAGPQPGYGSASSTGQASSGPSQQRQSQSRGQRRTYTVDEEDFERIFRGFAWAYSQTSGRRGRSGSAGAAGPS